jgi:hypothetical protein
MLSRCEKINGRLRTVGTTHVSSEPMPRRRQEGDEFPKLRIPTINDHPLFLFDIIHHINSTKL